MNHAKVQEHYQTQYEQHAPQLTGGQIDWVQQARAHAVEKLLQFGLPHARLETWKYTRTQAIENVPFTMNLLNSMPKLSTQELAAFILPNCDHLIFIDGCFCPEHSSLPATKDCFIAPLSTLNQLSHNELNQYGQYFGQLINLDQPSFQAINTALWQDGAIVHIKNKASLQKPLQILFISTDAADEKILPLRNLFIFEPDCKGSIIEHYVHHGKNTQLHYFTNTVTEIFLAKHANVKHIRITDEHAQSFHLGAVTVQQKEESQFTSFSLSFGGSLIRNEINTDLSEPRAKAALNGLFIGIDKQHIDHHLLVAHNAPNCQSDELYQGILTDSARGVFNGKIAVANQAQKTYSKQHSKNLLLSAQAEIDTKPELEIYANDVQCIHGATVGQLQEEALFYLQARGLSDSEARRMLICAFATEVLARIDDVTLQEQLNTLFLQHVSALYQQERSL